MKIFITGAKGFIGSHLAHSLKKNNFEVACCDNYSHPCKNRIKVDYADVRYYNDISPFVKWADVVFHLAAQIHVDKSIINPHETVDTNVVGTLNILEAAKHYGKKVIFASTSEIYGTRQGHNSMTEEHPLDAQSPYGASKIAADRLCKAYADTYGTKVVMLRNFNTFGPWQNDGSEGVSYGAVIGIFTRAALENKPLTIFGDGQQDRDYMYINDCLKGYMLCMENSRLEGETINVGSGSTVKIKELAEMIVKLTKSKSIIEYVAPRPGEVLSLKADMTKAKEYGLALDCDFERDLFEYISWYKKYGFKN